MTAPVSPADYAGASCATPATCEGRRRGPTCNRSDDRSSLPRCSAGSGPAPAQVPPTPAEVAAYRDLHAAAARDDADAIRRLAAAGAYLNARDGNGRDAASTSPSSRVYRTAALDAPRRGGADPALLDSQRYDAVTIAAVRDDVAMVEALIAGGASAGTLVTSVYDGTALIAASHSGMTASWGS